ncbi:hypothetical protein BDP27DRAFT_1366698 [Rhodocollybia butyracea]|uniref:Uncharacterized protein n=1 Tax=Rhodocollybia butyracea TaxID=206335 RepID=A0A9P5U4T9_9AGAR|nr:hypothetical protein BDP27DRAFT_1366698 [Rhodocollybia butyracea]
MSATQYLSLVQQRTKPHSQEPHTTRIYPSIDVTELDVTIAPEPCLSLNHILGRVFRVPSAGATNGGFKDESSTGIRIVRRKLDETPFERGQEGRAEILAISSSISKPDSELIEARFYAVSEVIVFCPWVVKSDEEIAPGGTGKKG